MLSLLTRIFAFTFAVSIVIVLGTRILAPLLPSSGVLQIITDRLTLLDIAQGQRITLPYDPLTTRLSPDRSRYVVAHTDDKQPSYTHYSVYSTDSNERLFLYGGRTDSVLSLPEWSPDSTRLAFLRRPTPDRYEQIVIINADGTGERQLTDGNWAVQAVVWWPSGDQLLATVFYLDTRMTDLALLDLTTRTLTRLTHDAYVENSARVLPDASAIVYTSDQGASLDIYTMHTDGTQPQPLIATDAIETRPAISPDGRWLVFSRFSVGHAFEIYRYELKSGWMERLLTWETVVHTAWWP